MIWFKCHSKNSRSQKWTLDDSNSNGKILSYHLGFKKTSFRTLKDPRRTFQSKYSTPKSDGSFSLHSSGMPILHSLRKPSPLKILNDDYFESGTLPHHTSPISIKLSNPKKRKLAPSKSRLNPAKIVCLKTRNKKRSGPKGRFSSKKFKSQSIFETIKNNSGISFTNDKSELIVRKLEYFLEQEDHNVSTSRSALF